MSRGAGRAVTIPGTCGQRHSWWEHCRWRRRPCARTWTSIRVDASGAGNGRNASPQTAQRFPVVFRSRTSTTMGSVAKPRRPGRALSVMLANQCKDCGRQFVQCSDHYRISGETRALPERLLRECISLRGMCRAVGVSLTWLVGVLVTCFEALPDHWHVQPVTWHGDVMMRRREGKPMQWQAWSRRRRISHGCGWPRMPRRATRVPCIWRIAAARVPAPVGHDASGVLATRHVFSRSVCRL
jgi:hypothetical protein